MQLRLLLFQRQAPRDSSDALLWREFEGCGPEKQQAEGVRVIIMIAELNQGRVRASNPCPTRPPVQPGLKHGHRSEPRAPFYRP
eukprot:2871539-Rhodomonas_salina.2